MCRGGKLGVLVFDMFEWQCWLLVEWHFFLQAPELLPCVRGAVRVGAEKKKFIHGLGLNQSSALLQKTVQHTAPGMVAGFINSESRPSFSVVEVSYRL